MADVLILLQNIKRSEVELWLRQRYVIDVVNAFEWKIELTYYKKIRTFKYINMTYCTNEFDLCDDCMKSFLKWMNEPSSKTDEKTDDNMYGTVKVWV